MKTVFSKILLPSAFLYLALAAPAHAETPAAPVATIPAHSLQTLPSFEALAEKLLPTVVNISTTTKIKSDGKPEMQAPDLQLPPGSPFEEFFKEFYDQYKNQQPRGGQNVSSLGSGFIIDAQQGYVVTNNHVIKDADEIKVILHNDTSLDAQLIGVDEKTDLAVLKVTPPKDKPLTATVWGNSDKAKVGSWVIAIGNPFGLGGTVTAGIVSARQRDINAGPYDDFIQTDASINRGNSGGPMFNLQGEVIGVNTAIFSPTGGSVGIGFAVPATLAKSVTEQLIKYGKTKRGWLGVRIQDVTPEIAEALKLPAAKGALVSSVTPKGPADKAGVLAGDVIVKFNGQDIDQLRRLPRLVAESEVGGKAALTVLRKGKEVALSVELGQLETAEAQGQLGKTDPAQKTGKTGIAAVEIPGLGFSAAVADDALRQKLGLGADITGVIVTDVSPEGAAAEKGLAPGDQITEVDQEAVDTADALKARVEAAQKANRNSVLLFVVRGEDRRFVPLKIGKK